MDSIGVREGSHCHGGYFSSELAKGGQQRFNSPNGRSLLALLPRRVMSQALLSLQYLHHTPQPQRNMKGFLRPVSPAKMSGTRWGHYGYRGGL